MPGVAVRLLAETLKQTGRSLCHDTLAPEWVMFIGPITIEYQVASRKADSIHLHIKPGRGKTSGQGQAAGRRQSAQYTFHSPLWSRASRAINALAFSASQRIPTP